MSKSLKNFITIKVFFVNIIKIQKLILLFSKDFLEQYTAEDMRWFCLQHHYRSNVEFNEDRIEDARTIHSRFSNFLAESKVYQAKNHVISLFK